MWDRVLHKPTHVVVVLQWFGKLAIVFVPILIAAALGTGLFAAATYNSGADKVLQP